MSRLEELWQSDFPKLSELPPATQQEVVAEFALVYLSMRWVNRMWRTFVAASTNNSNPVVKPQTGHHYLLLMDLLAQVVMGTAVESLTPERHEAVGKVYTPPATTAYGKFALILLFHRSGLERDTINHLCHYQGHSVKVQWIEYAFSAMQKGLLEFDSHLAQAFVAQTIARSKAEKRPPMLGDFIMSPPRFPALEHLELNHIRLHIDGKGIWFGLVSLRGEVWVGYWSEDNALMWTLAPGDAWPLRVFFACLWLDLKSVKHQTVRVTAKRKSEEFGASRVKEKYVVLPRRITTLEWEGEKMLFGEGGKDGIAKNVRAHYRRLPDKWQASEAAVTLARQSGFPVPPSGYTFVQAYHTGDLPPSEKDTRLISTGLDVAWVALGY